MGISTRSRQMIVVLGVVALMLGGLAGAGIISGISDLSYSGKFYLFHIKESGPPVALGPLASLSGCSTYAPVVEQNVGPTDTKQLGTPKFNPCIVEIGYDMSTSFFSWMDAAWHGTYETRDLWIVQVASNRTRIEIQDAVIGNVTLPRADASSDSNTFLRVELLPTGLTPPATCCSTLTIPRDITASPLIASDYRFTMTGFSDAPKTTKVETYEIRNARSGCDVGCPANRAIFAHLRSYISASVAAPLYGYFKSFVIDGNDTDANERVVTVQWMNPEFSSTLLSVRFDGTGINYIDPYSLKSAGTSLPKVRYNLYIEQANIKKGAF